MDAQLADRIMENELFSQMTPEQVSTITNAMKKRTCKAGEVLVKKGQPMDSVFIVESGELTKVFPDGQRKAIRAGEVTGVLHFYTKDPAAADIVIAQDNTVVRTTSTEEFHKLLSAHQDIAEMYIGFLNRKVRRGLSVISKISNPSGGKTRIAFFDSKPYMKDAFGKLNNQEKFQFAITWLDVKLGPATAMLASGHQVVCCFVHDVVNAQVIDILHAIGVEMIALRCAGYDKVDVKKAYEYKMSITRVPAYSPYAVAEFAVGLMLTLNRKLHKAYHRVRDFNFSLNGFVGFDMRGKTVGVFGTGKIGYTACEILLGFGCKILAMDVFQNEDLKKKGVKYVDKDELLANSDIITMHAPLLPSTTHWLDAAAISKCKKGVLIINTSRGPLIETKALLDGILSGKIGGAGLDVIEGEESFFFENLEDATISDNTMVRLNSCSNVVLTSHQAFLTQEALENIADSTFNSVLEFVGGKKGDQLKNAVKEEYK